MTAPPSDWAYLTDKSGRYWYHLQDGTRVDVAPDSAQKSPQRAIYAIPTNDLVSHPHWVSSKDEAIISEIVTVESEKLGVKPNSGPGRIAAWKPVEINGARTLVQSVAIPWQFDGLVDGPTEFVAFPPQYSLYPPPENAVTLWRENDGWVAGYSRENRWAHVQPLGEISAGAVASEIQLTLMELFAKDVLEKNERIIIWEPDEPELLATLTDTFEIPVAFRPRPAPSVTGAAGWELEPHVITEKKLARARTRRVIWIAICSCLLLLLLVAAALIHIRLLEADNAKLEQKIAANIETADRIELAQEQWAALSPAVDPERNPLELFHRISSVMPEKGFRLTGFQHQGHRTLRIEGEGATMANALQIKGALEKSGELSQYGWEIGPPRTKNDLIEFDATGVLRTDDATSEP